MFKRLIIKASDNAARKEQEAFLSLVQVGTDSEMAFALSTAAIMRHGLKTTSLVSRPFPDHYFLGEAPVDDKAAAELSMYNMELIVLKNITVKNSHPSQHVVASGLNIFVATFRALARPSLFASGRLIWRELLRGVDDYLEVMASLRPDMSRAEVEAIFPAPNMLAPDEA